MGTNNFFSHLGNSFSFFSFSRKGLCVFVIGRQLHFSVNRNQPCGHADHFFYLGQSLVVVLNLLLHLQKKKTKPNVVVVAKSAAGELSLQPRHAETCRRHGSVTQQASAEVTVMSFGCR